MKLMRKINLSTILLALLVVPALAEEIYKTPTSFYRLDVNKDEMITPQEASVSVWLSDNFWIIDSDGDNMISFPEFSRLTQ